MKAAFFVTPVPGGGSVVPAGVQTVATGGPVPAARPGTKHLPQLPTLPMSQAEPPGAPSADSAAPPRDVKTG
ncbi:hypothetical protein [Escherichia coli]|uniref:hypothetical protein n=1 Tax=Escherichia coli TaxID=562 RepID=UPI0013548788|nr:hypothetical protein [Escherichia coli]